MVSKIRIGAISYLNAKPLYYRLAESSPRIQLTVDLPSRLADGLAVGSLDVSLIPSIEYLRGAARGYEILPGFAIAARGAVRSVKLLSRVPLAEIDRLALDIGSRTSQALTRVWLHAMHGVQPTHLEPLPMGTSPLDCTADAVLVIGDRAMNVPDGPFREVVDLAEAWNRMTGRPFVFGLWVARRGLDLGDLPTLLARSRADGLANLAALAALHGPRLGLDEATCLDYLTHRLSYDLGEPEISGLTRFAHMAAELGLAPEGAKLVFHGSRLAPAAPYAETVPAESLAGA